MVIRATEEINNLVVQIAALNSPKRLVIYGGARALGDNGAFLHASKNVIKDYKNDLPIKSVFMKSGIKQLIEALEEQSENTVQSLDIFCHGSQLGLYTVMKASLDHSLTAEFVHDENLASNIYRDWNTKQDQWRLFGSSDWSNLYTISDLNLKAFTNESKIEIHGCNTARNGDTNTFSALLSKALYKEGKKRSVVIGHADYTNPNIGGTKEISKQDYRHGLRIIYNNGKVIAETKVSGRISANFVKNALGG